MQTRASWDRSSGRAGCRAATTAAFAVAEKARRSAGQRGGARYGYGRRCIPNGSGLLLCVYHALRSGRVGCGARAGGALVLGASGAKGCRDSSLSMRLKVEMQSTKARPVVPEPCMLMFHGYSEPSGKDTV